MCAIAGILELQSDERSLAGMLETMKRRGPDDSGVYKDRGCILLHRRLAIIDPERGRQPMALQWGQEQFILVYNGELYNTEEIRSQLAALGHVFHGHSDTEVVLHAYVQWREACVHRMNGIFAFAVWEEKARKLFLARDRIGVKPLFYSLHKGGLLFASEIKTILKFPGVEARLDREGAAQLILLGPGRLPGSGIFAGIQELEPGCYGFYEKGRLDIQRYWMLRDREHRESFPDTVDQVRYLVTDSIRRQMVSDVPIGTFLSGGLDSSIITAVCAEEMKKRGERLCSFSVDYENNDRNFTANKFQPTSDGDYIRIMQQYLNTQHYWTVLNPEDLSSELENATCARDLPGMADVDFSLLAFCRKIRTHVKVALSGECADEIFGGYPWYRDPEVRAVQGFPWAQNTQVRASLLSSDVNCQLEPEDFVFDAYDRTCRESDILPGTAPAERRIKEMVNLNFRWFMQTLLDRKDRMSMYSSLEVRVPFCDYRIAEYLYGVPWAYKDYQGREKGLLRKAMEGILPDPVLYRKKSPYPKTFDPGYDRIVTNRLNDLFATTEDPLFYLVKADRLKEYLNGESLWPWYGQLMGMPQTKAYFLQIAHWLRKYQVQFNF